MINALLGRSKKSSKKTEVLDESLRPLGKRQVVHLLLRSNLRCKASCLPGLAHNQVLLECLTQLVRHLHGLIRQGILHLQGQVVPTLLEGLSKAFPSPTTLRALRMPKPNSALSSKREFAQAGPSPLVFVV